MSLRSDAEFAIQQTLLIPLQNNIAAAVLPLFQKGNAYANELCAYSTMTANGFAMSIAGFNDVANNAIVIKLYAEDTVFGRNCNVSWTYKQTTMTGATSSTVTLTDISAAQFAPYNVTLLAGAINALTAFYNAITAQISSSHTLPAPTTVIALPPAPVAPAAYAVTITPTGQSPIPANTGVTMYVNQTAQINISPMPTYAIAYQNTNSGVISVSPSGLITAINKGSAQIQVGQFVDGNPQFETINVYVPS